MHHSDYISTTHVDPPLSNQAYATVMNGIASGLGGIIERVDPGLTPAVETEKYALSQQLEHDWLQGEDVNTFHHNDTITQDPDYYTYSYGPPQSYHYGPYTSD